MRRIIIALVAALASLVPAAAPAAGTPGSTSAMPDSGTAEHVTQADLQADAPDQYVVVKGDTLWAISGRFLKDPWKWPQIWEMNRDQIKNPHWIYPGDVIRLDRTGAYPHLFLQPGGGAGVVRLEPRVRVEPLSTAIPTIPGSAIGPFLTQPLVVEAHELDNAPHIIATEESRVIVGAGDIAYADRIGTADPVNWQVFRPGVELRDPQTREILGYEAKYIGDARVKRYGNPTTLEITKSREEINRGDRLTPARETGFPSYVPHAPSRPIQGEIMSVDGGVSELGQFRVVAINRGARDGMEVGDVLASYRRGEVVGDDTHSMHNELLDSGWFKDIEIKPVYVVPEPPVAPPPPGGRKGVPLEGVPVKLPDERNGLVIVFRVFEKMSYGLVMRATKPIYVGDVVKTP